MSVGQGLLAAPLDVGALTVLELQMELREVGRSADHAGSLREVLELQGLYSSTGHDLATVSHVALFKRCSEARAGQLLTDAQQLFALPGAFEALDCGLLSVEQSRTLVAQLLPLSDEVAFVVWERLKARLIADEGGGVVRTPARLRTLLAGWVMEADADAAVRRRKDAQDAAGVDYRRREDGLVDLFANGLTAPDAQACLARIRARSAPFGSTDSRSAGKRRLDAFVDMLLGRDPLPAGTDQHDVDVSDVDGREREDGDGDGRGGGGRHCPPGCGCRAGAPVPCGADISVLVPLGAALGTTDELAELVGHGPIEPDLLADVLLAAPRLRAVRLDETGIPVAVGDQVVQPGRDDPVALREALLRLAEGPPGRRQPRHRNDHPPSAADPTAPTASRDRSRPQLLSQPHPTDKAGPYRVPTRLRRLLLVRRPLCEWPGCGHRATRCDMDHDLAWPYGPTCGCNLGPLCRRHHRVKQLGWGKQRTPDTGVRWTGPTGRSWTSPVPHDPPAWPARPLPAMPGPADLLDQLGPLAQEDELWHQDPDSPVWDDPDGQELRADDIELTDDHDMLRQRLLYTGTRWCLDLDDPYLWAGRYAGSEARVAVE